jgi:proline racemase
LSCGRAIIPSVGGRARMTGLTAIFMTTRDSVAHWFVVK